MMRVNTLPLDASEGVAIVTSPKDLCVISEQNCPAVIWSRQPMPGFQSWINGLSPDQLPTGRIILRPTAVRQAVEIACDRVDMPDCAERTQLIDDIAALSDIFADLMKTPYVHVRLAVIENNACRKFHTDAVTARLICTYRGVGTQYGTSVNDEDPARVFAAPTCAPILLRGTLWPEDPASGFAHRSPPIEGSGQTRLVLVLDPVDDPGCGD